MYCHFCRAFFDAEAFVPFNNFHVEPFARKLRRDPFRPVHLEKRTSLRDGLMLYVQFGKDNVRITQTAKGSSTLINNAALLTATCFFFVSGENIAAILKEKEMIMGT